MPFGARPYATHWQDWVNLGLGLWLFVSPWMLNYGTMPAAAWNAWALGIVIAAVAVAALIQFTRWMEWVNVAVGVWLVAAPWLLGYAGAGETRPVFVHVILGLLVGLLALWDALANGRDRIAWE